MSEILSFPFALYPDWMVPNVGMGTKFFEKNFEIYKKRPDGQLPTGRSIYLQYLVQLHFRTF